ncbi:hypothetical protein A1O7_02990 [Cladophialophora yegresii CBS 114405]|uniref:Uncharacterized protein n=1 Tax=Cladophialophora yegresii CBS 114405 TaxID=1182544 RepID=W9W3B2_9EURO|nr:uncharacterized protein A1O7_02990 [Cladophialophora yegresii CBS 114405]EXJ62552.1 hypothetical protein A1O7_02990 [Cladophialophora yegresii CBS 114405]
MSSSQPAKKPKKTIHEFFEPYLKSTVPAKRSSPSLEESEGAGTSRKDEAHTRTPKAKDKQNINNDRVKPPGSSARSPFSAPGSRTSLSIRSKTSHAKTPIAPASVYKQASIFSSPTWNDATPKQPQPKSFSFADLPSSAQAVLKDGEVIEVLDSDEDDTDSLESLEDFFVSKKTGHSAPFSSSPDDDQAALEAERVRTLGLFLGTSRKQGPLVGKDKIRELRAKEKAFAFNMASLLDDHFEDEEVESNVRKARADVEEAAKGQEAANAPDVDKKLLAAVATTEDGEHGVARLMDAVDRTEALTSQQVFLFCGVNALNDWHDEEPSDHPFPEDAIPDDLWKKGDNEARSRAYLSGYMADLATRRGVKDQVLNWTLENVVLERSDELRQAYIDCLRSASSTWTRNHVSARDVQSVFQTMGADTNSLKDSVEIKPRHRLLKAPARRNPKYLLAVLDLFQAICQDMDFQALSKLTSVLCRLVIDAEVMSDGCISARVEDLLGLLLALPDVEMRTHVAERMLADVGKYLKDPTLQAHLLSHIPPTSPLACKVRVLLSQVFLLGSSVLKKSTLVSPNVSLDILTNHISTSPDFDTKRRKGGSTIDYIALRARTHLLDVAICDGGLPASFTSRADEQAFNKSVDRLADAVKTIEVAINDPGASHMTRTEAKDDLRALQTRLLFCVRTEVRPKRHIFDGTKMREAAEVRSEEQGKDFMKRFLGRVKDKKAEKGRDDDGGTLVANDEKSVNSTSSSGTSETEKQIRRQLNLDG